VQTLLTASLAASKLEPSRGDVNPELIYEAFLKVLKKGSPYGFQVLADRAFGKLKEIHQIDHSPYKDVSNEDLEAHVEQLEAKLVASLEERGYTITKPPQLLPPVNDSKPN
jgi:hypothetical protein